MLCTAAELLLRLLLRCVAKRGRAAENAGVEAVAVSPEFVRLPHRTSAPARDEPPGCFALRVDLLRCMALHIHAVASVVGAARGAELAATLPAAAVLRLLSGVATSMTATEVRVSPDDGVLPRRCTGHTRRLVLVEY